MREKITLRSQDTKGTLKPFHTICKLRVRAVQLLREMTNSSLEKKSARGTWTILSYGKNKEALTGYWSHQKDSEIIMKEASLVNLRKF